MGTIKDRNGMDLTEAEDIKRWQEYIEELYKKDLHDPDNHDGIGEAGFINMSQHIDGNQSHATGPDELANGCS